MKKTSIERVDWLSKFEPNLLFFSQELRVRKSKKKII
jgi:hypothetical protein